MNNNLPGNFGNPYSITDFSQQGGPGPAQIWDPSRPSTSYRGGQNQLYVTGGSFPQSGKAPWDSYRMTEPSYEAWWGYAGGAEPKPAYNFGLGPANNGR